MDQRKGVPGRLHRGAAKLGVLAVLLAPVFLSAAVEDESQAPSQTMATAPSDAALADVDCPVAPVASHRGRYANIHSLPDRAGLARAASPAAASAPYPVTKEYRNPVDQEIFGKMAADGVVPTVRAGDTEFLRRV